MKEAAAVSRTRSPRPPLSLRVDVSHSRLRLRGNGVTGHCISRVTGCKATRIAVSFTYLPIPCPDPNGRFGRAGACPSAGRRIGTMGRMVHRNRAGFGEGCVVLQRLIVVASEQMAKHGLVGWSFGLAESKRRLGVCKYRKKRI